MRIPTMFPLLFLTAALPAAEQLDEIRAHFDLGGKPIQPGIVQLFETDPADVDPIVRSVDLSAAQNSNRFADTASKEPLGWVRSKKHDTDDSFAYEFIGALPSGALVIHTATSSGGSGTSESALLFRATMEAALPGALKPEPHAVLHLLQTISLGDRAGAVFHIDGAKVTITRNKGPDGDARDPLTINDPGTGAAASAAPASAAPSPSTTGTGETDLSK